MTREGRCIDTRAALIQGIASRADSAPDRSAVRIGSPFSDATTSPTRSGSAYTTPSTSTWRIDRIGLASNKSATSAAATTPPMTTTQRRRRRPAARRIAMRRSRNRERPIGAACVPRSDRGASSEITNRVLPPTLFFAGPDDLFDVFAGPDDLFDVLAVEPRERLTQPIRSGRGRRRFGSRTFVLDASRSSLTCSSSFSRSVNAEASSASTSGSTSSKLVMRNRPNELQSADRVPIRTAHDRAHGASRPSHRMPDHPRRPG